MIDDTIAIPVSQYKAMVQALKECLIPDTGMRKDLNYIYVTIDDNAWSSYSLIYEPPYGEGNMHQFKVRDTDRETIL